MDDRRRTRAGGALLVAMALVAAACSEGSDVAPGPTETATAVATTSPSPSPSVTASPTVSSEPVDLDPPGSVVTGGLETTVREVTVSTATPATFLDAEPQPGPDLVAYVDAVVGWEDGYPGGTTQVEVDTYALVLTDGTTAPAMPVDFRSSVQVRDGTPGELLLAFVVPDAAAVASADLRVGAVGLVPATMPLSGDAPEDSWPVPVDVGDEAVVSIEGGCGGGEATVTLTGGEVDLDGGVDHAGDRIVLNGPARAEADHVFVRLAFRTVAQSGSCGGAIVNDDQYRLVVDGLPTAPLNSHAELLDPGTGTELVFGWQVPVDAELAVEVGTVDGTTATFPVPLPELDLPA